MAHHQPAVIVGLVRVLRMPAPPGGFADGSRLALWCPRHIPDTRIRTEAPLG